MPHSLANSATAIIKIIKDIKIKTLKLTKVLLCSCTLSRVRDGGGAGLGTYSIPPSDWPDLALPRPREPDDAFLPDDDLCLPGDDLLLPGDDLDMS